MVLVEAAVAGEVDKALAYLADHRLWSGSIPEVHQVVWGAPGQTWTARKDQASWKLTGPDQAATRQPSARLEMALWNFQKLEAEKNLPPGRGPQRSPAFQLNSWTRPENPCLNLEELGAKAKGKDKDLLMVRTAGGKSHYHGPDTQGAIPPVAGRNAPADGG